MLLSLSTSNIATLCLRGRCLRLLFPYMVQLSCEKKNSLFTIDKGTLPPDFFFFKEGYLFYFFFFKGIPLFLFFIYLFMAVLGLLFCARAFSSCGERGPLFIAVRGPLTIAASHYRGLSCCRAQAPDAQAQ